MATCPRCGRDDADVDVTREGPVSYALVICGCWPEPFEAKHDRRVHEPGECDLFVPRMGEAA